MRARWLWFALPALAAAAMAFLLIVVAAPRNHSTTRDGRADDELRVKGGATWHVFANHRGHTFAVRDGAVLAAGDQIEFVVYPHGARYVIIGSVDGAGTASIYYPYAGNQSAPIDGEGVELAGSIVLDAAPGPERLYALFSDDPISADVVRAQLRAVGARGVAAIRGARALSIRATAQATLVFEKAQP